MSFYPAELAAIHDAGFGDFARAAVAELLPRLPGDGLVVELGCGTGISCELLGDAGYDVLGIDISADMLAIAAARAPHASFRQGSVWDAEIPPCAAVTAIGEVINYSADARASAERLPELFARVHAALAPGGVFLFDFATPGRVALREHGPGIRTGDGWSIETAAEEDAVSQTLVRRMTLEYRGRRRSETHTLQLYEREWVRKCLEGPGFRSEALEGYSDFGFWPGYAAFAASKPA